jgi:hypothetical protein
MLALKMERIGPASSGITNRLTGSAWFLTTVNTNFLFFIYVLIPITFSLSPS